MTGNIRKQNTASHKAGNQYMELVPCFAFVTFLAVVLIAVSASPAFAAGIFETAKNAMQTVYKDVAGIKILVKKNHYLLGSAHDDGSYCNLFRKYYSTEYLRRLMKTKKKPVLSRQKGGYLKR